MMSEQEDVVTHLHRWAMIGDHYDVINLEKLRRDASNAESEILRLRQRVEELEGALKEYSTVVETTAFEIPAPNEFTPKLVALSQQARMLADYYALSPTNTETER